MDETSLLHDLFKSCHFDLFNLLVGSLLCINPVKVLVLGQNEENRTNRLEKHWLVTIEKLGESPRFEYIVTPDQQVGTLIDLSHGHRTATLDVEVVDVKTKVVDNFVLHRCRVETWANTLGLEQPSE